MTIHKKGVPILTLEEWEEHAGPARDHHWQDYFSAKESARFWVRAKAFPDSISALLTSNQDFGQVTSWRAEPEARLPIDGRRGNTRNADLLIEANDGASFVIAVEAKVNESFGETVAEALCNGLEQKLKLPSSGALARIQDLATALFGERRESEPAIGELRYQLLTATVGAMRAAQDRKLARAVVLVQEFLTEKTDAERRAKNSADLDASLVRLTHNSGATLSEGQLLHVPELPRQPLLENGTQLYIGKVTTDVRDEVQ